MWGCAADAGWRWWVAGASKVGVGDEWLSWPPQRQFRRLKLIANNSRFAVLVGKGEVRKLASRVLDLSLCRLSGDMRAAHGFPALLAGKRSNEAVMDLGGLLSWGIPGPLQV